MSQNMETDPFNVSMRKFLKQVGVTSQRALEKTVEGYRRIDIDGRVASHHDAVASHRDRTMQHRFPVAGQREHDITHSHAVARQWAYTHERPARDRRQHAAARRANVQRRASAHDVAR